MYDIFVYNIFIVSSLLVYIHAHVYTYYFSMLIICLYMYMYMYILTGWFRRSSIRVHIRSRPPRPRHPTHTHYVRTGHLDRDRAAEGPVRYRFA